MWDEGLENLIDFDSFNEQTLRYKNAAGIGLSALDLIRGNVRGIKRGLSFFKNIHADFDLTILSKAGKVIDREGLTKAGRALDKHGNRPGSVFPKAVGNSAAKNAKGQAHLEQILSHPQATSYSNRFGGIDVFAPDGRGARFDSKGSLMGFLQPKGN